MDETDRATLEAMLDDLTGAIGHLLRRMRADLNLDGLSWSQAAALGHLDRVGSATIADLARAEGVKPQSMGVTIAALEQDGHVQRRLHPTDGRQVLFSLTAKGLDSRKARNAAKRAWLVEAALRLDPAERRTLAAAATLIRRLGAA